MLKGAIYAIVPVIVFLVRGAKDTAISADTRAFRAYPKRTNMHPVTIGSVDKSALAVMTLVLLITIVAVFMGLGRAIPYS